MMKKILIFLLFGISAFAVDFFVMPVSADPVFNYFFSINAAWGFVLVPLFAALSLFRL